jgi:hypothetical protein
VARVLDVASGAAVGCDVVAGWSVRRSGGRLRLVGPGGPDGQDRPDGARSAAG